MVKKAELFKSAERDIAVLTRKPEKHDIFLDGAKKGIRHGELTPIVWTVLASK